MNLIYLAVYMFFDCLRFAIVGMVRGLGKSKEIYFGSLVLYYFIGIPLSYTLGISMEKGNAGLLIGAIIGNMLVVIFLTVKIIWWIDILSSYIQSLTLQ